MTAPSPAVPGESEERRGYDDAAAAEFYSHPENLVPAGPAERMRKRRPHLTKHVPVRFDVDLIAAVKRCADRDGMSVSSWIRHVVRREVAGRQPVTTTVSNPDARIDWVSP